MEPAHNLDKTRRFCAPFLLQYLQRDGDSFKENCSFNLVSTCSGGESETKARECRFKDVFPPEAVQSTAIERFDHTNYNGHGQEKKLIRMTPPSH